jgi:Predicted nucleotide-binding protein containing TIR-like domain
MKPSLFVGSSSEAIRIAEAVQQNLQHIVDVTIWNQSVFELSRTIVHNLLKSVRRHDYAVFVFASDDVMLLRNEIQLATRDNVMFELLTNRVRPTIRSWVPSFFEPIPAAPKCGANQHSGTTIKAKWSPSSSRSDGSP